MKHLAIIWFLFLGQVLHAQTFVASTNARQVIEGGTFVVSYKIENASATNFEPPEFHPFRVVSGPSQSRSTTIVNGRRSSSISVSYTLVAPKEGRYTIPSATIDVGNRRVSSNSLIITVKDGGDVQLADDIFIRVELDTDTLYIGQQVVMELKLYSTKAVERYDILHVPEFNDVYVKDLPRYRRQAQLEVVDGVQYQTQVLKRTALFPQKSGTFTFDGLVARLGIPTDSRQRSGFFFTTQLITKNVSSNDFGFTVLPLPSPKPERFSGGVGSYSARAQTDRTRLSTDDALTLTLTVQGDGDQRLLLPPELDLGENFDTYDANILRTDDRPGEDRNRFAKVFEYLIIPRKAGQLTLKPDFIYYSVDSQEYVTIVPDSFQLEVRQGTSESRALDRFNAQQDLEVKPVLHTWESYEKPTIFLQSMWYWLSWGIWSCAFIGLIWFRQRQLKIEGADPTVLRFNRANKVARKRLQKAETLMKEGQDKAFFEEVALATKQFLSDKLHVDPARFSRQTIGSELEAIHVSSDLKADVIQLLNDCDLAIFASSYAPDKEAVYERAIRIVSELEQLLGQRDI